MQATVQVTPEGMVIANLDSDDYAADEDDRALMNLKLDDMLDQCSRVAIETWIDIRRRIAAEADE